MDIQKFILTGYTDSLFRRQLCVNRKKGSYEIKSHNFYIQILFRLPRIRGFENLFEPIGIHGSIDVQ